MYNYELVLKETGIAIFSGVNISINLDDIKSPLNLLDFDVELLTYNLTDEDCRFDKFPMSSLVIKNNKYNMIMSNNKNLNKTISSVELVLLNDDAIIIKAICLDFIEIKDSIFKVSYKEIEVDNNKLNADIDTIERDMFKIRKEKQSLDEKLEKLIEKSNVMNKIKL